MMALKNLAPVVWSPIARHFTGNLKMRSLPGQILIATLAVTLLAGCASQDPFPVETASAGDVNQAYVLRPGETVKIVTYGEEPLTGEFNIGSDGLLSFPLIGSVKAAGVTPNSLAEAITAALSNGYLARPNVTVEIKNFRPVYVLGEVNKPGEYPYTADMTVLAAIAKANGFTYRAQQKRVFIKRAEQPNEILTPLSSNTPVYPGDIIRITERYF
jgi:protein involved in polysaccharide export with SLBB domain